MLQLHDRPRRFLPADLKMTNWETLAPFGQLLLERDISTRDAFDQFLLDESEFEAAIGEERTWRYIRNSTHTNDDIAQQSYEQFITTIDPPLAELANQLNQKVLASPFVDQPQNEAEKILFRGLRLKASLFRTENIPLDTELEQLSTESDQLRGAMTITLDGETMTPQQAGIRLFWADRTKREETWRAMQARRLQDKDKFDTIFDAMVQKRHQVAVNAGYKNYRDYMFAALQRFDYTPDDCFAFHDAIEKHVLPLLSKLYQKRAQQMQLPVLKPWDVANDPFGRPALKAFDGVRDMIDKSIDTLDAIDPFFGDIARAQDNMGRLDLDSRPHKRPGGYNANMPESHVPFMFANVTSLVDDVSTFIHEAGHATHDILSHTLPLQSYRNYPMEIAEVASMSMELFAFDKWDIFFADPTDCQRAQEESLASILTLLAWVAQIDAFQHEIYTRPELTIEQRHDVWNAIATRFAAPGIDRGGFEQEYRTQWHKQGHVFSVPFYYIEYGIAQLGALQLWRNYMNDPKTTIRQYKDALALGYTRPLPVLFATAGIKFDLSPAMIAELVPFLMKQLEKFES